MHNYLQPVALFTNAVPTADYTPQNYGYMNITSDLELSLRVKCKEVLFVQAGSQPCCYRTAHGAEGNSCDTGPVLHGGTDVKPKEAGNARTS
jgi:hypothetical protein